MIKANKRNFLFEEVKQTAPERNGFDLSHENKQTCRANKVYPFECFEALPNDDFELQVEQFVRLQPSLSPTMHRIKAYWHWFFVPLRLCWKFWEEFISRGNGKKLPADQTYTPPEPPYITLLNMLYYSPAVAKLTSTYTVGSSQFSGDYDEFFASLVNRFPEILWKRTTDDTMPIKGYIRVPRIANALQIPDTCVPLYYWDSNRTLQAFQASEIAGQISINTAAGSNDLIPIDLVGYLQSVHISIFPFVAVLRNWIEYYRDENLDEDLTECLDWFMTRTGSVYSTNDTERGYLRTLFQLHYRCWEKDYFTTATLLPQKSPDVEIPGTGAGTASLTATTVITGGDPIESEKNSLYSHFDGNADGNANFSNGNLNDGNMAHTSHVHQISSVSIADSLSAETTITSSGSSDSKLSPTTVAQVRRAFALQRWFEKAVRTGTRYIESLKAFFNSDAGDARLQRSEYIGGSSSPVQISDVVQTSATDDNSDTVQGNLAGYGIVSDTSEFIRYHCPEHGFIIGMFSILGRTSYAQGIPRMYLRPTWLDYAWPEFEHIGEQGIKQIELFAAPLSKDILNPRKNLNFSPYNFVNHQTADEIFGYQSRYAEYKQVPDRFGSGFSSSLDFWSLGRIFADKPTLSAPFVHSNLSDRNFAVVGNDQENAGSNTLWQAEPDQYDEAYDYDTYICDFWVDCKKVTSLTLYSEPI